jgi:tRNA (mo5U34)-methyltransferase
VDIGELVSELPGHKRRLGSARDAIGQDIAWYPYDILGNLLHLDLLLTGQYRDLDRLADSMPVADIGSADGDLAFVLEQACGWRMDIIDSAPTNMNGLDGARALRAQLGSEARIHDIDLDTQFHLPRDRYGLVILLGILYHLQNPYYVLRELSNRATYVLLSTRVARFAGPQRTPIGDLPVAYLVGPTETNNDATNYWMFSPRGLDQLVQRAGWMVLERASFGDLEASDPSSPDHDERCFLLLRSKSATGEHLGIGSSGSEQSSKLPPLKSRSQRLTFRSASHWVVSRGQRLLAGGRAESVTGDSDQSGDQALR